MYKSLTSNYIGMDLHVHNFKIILFNAGPLVLSLLVMGWLLLHYVQHV